MSQLFNMLSRFVTAFLPRSKQVTCLWTLSLCLGYCEKCCHELGGAALTLRSLFQFFGLNTKKWDFSVIWVVLLVVFLGIFPIPSSILHAYQHCARFHNNSNLAYFLSPFLICDHYIFSLTAFSLPFQPPQKESLLFWWFIYLLSSAEFFHNWALNLFVLNIIGH